MKSNTIFFVGFLLCFMPSFLKSQIGNPAPDFTVTDTHGGTHTLYTYLDSGKVVVLDFFYTTCTPCQFYSPQVNLAYEKYGCNDANVIFMSIDYNDTNAEVIAYDDEYQIQYPSISGLDGGGNAVVTQYGIIGFPTFYVIDSSRTIIEQIDPPTLQVFDYRFQQHGIGPAACNSTSISEVSESIYAEIFPNPVRSDGAFNLHMPGSKNGSVYFQIYNSSGQIVKEGDMKVNHLQIAELSLDNDSSGLFFIRIIPTTGDKIYFGKFVTE